MKSNLEAEVSVRASADRAVVLPGQVLARWQHVSTVDSTITVLPDGCMDLILHVDPTGKAGWHISGLAHGAVDVPGQVGDYWLGYRLQPGASFDAAGLLIAARDIWHSSNPRRHGGQNASCPDADVEKQLLEAIAHRVHLDARTRQALARLAQAATVGRAARSVGVSERSLERLVSQATGRPPRYWRALARVRRAALAVAAPQPLAAIAADHGYADQAHFSRDCRRWLGQTPSDLRRSPELLASLAEHGYG